MRDIILKNLNECQRAAATETEGYIRVVAGAGSGKTRTLTARYMYLAEMLGVSTASILCVTFTNRAAGEMKKRIRRVLPDRDLGRITTFHGFCVSLLKEDISRVGYPAAFVVLDDNDKGEDVYKRQTVYKAESGKASERGQGRDFRMRYW